MAHVVAEPCFDLQNPDARIAACMKALNTEKLTDDQKAIGYSNMGVAWHQKGLLEPLQIALAVIDPINGGVDRRRALLRQREYGYPVPGR